MGHENDQLPPLLFRNHLRSNVTPALQHLFENPIYQKLEESYQCNEVIDFWPLKDEIDWDLTYKKCENIHPQNFEELSEDEKFDWAMENDIETVYVPVTDHWVVSLWLADKLNEKEEIIVDFFGALIWGRQSETPVAKDSTLMKIARDHNDDIPTPYESPLPMENLASTNNLLAKIDYFLESKSSILATPVILDTSRKQASLPN